MFGLDITPQIIDPNVFDAVQLSSYSLSVATTVLSTIIIAIRILIVSRMPGASRQPRLAMVIIVESAALYSISAIVYTSMIVPSAVTYNLYAELFFAYMAVESHSSYLSVLIF
jgi:hypothetical protein